MHLASTQGEIHLYLAEWEAARETFQRGLALAEELGNPERQAGYRAGLALAARGQQDLAGAITLLPDERYAGKLALFGGVEKVRFRRLVRPGDELLLQVDVERLSARGGWAQARACVDGETACEARMFFAIG